MRIKQHEYVSARREYTPFLPRWQSVRDRMAVPGVKEPVPDKPVENIEPQSADASIEKAWLKNELKAN